MRGGPSVPGEEQHHWPQTFPTPTNVFRFDAKVDATVPFATNTWKIICWDIENGLCERDSSLSIHLVGNFDTREIR